VLEAERGSRGLVRVACHYSAWLENPANSLRRLVDGLGIGPMAKAAIARAVSSVDPGQRHHREESLPRGGEGLEDLCAAVAEAGRKHGAVPAFDDRFAARVAAVSRESAATLQPRADALCRARRSVRAFATEARTLDAALGDTRALALARLAEVAQLGKQLVAVDAALAESTALALERLEAMATLDAALRETREGLARAEILNAQLGNRLVAVDAALAESTALALERLEAMATLDAALRETRAGLARTEALAVERMLRIATLEAERDALQAAGEALEARVGQLDDQLAAMRAHWAWRLTAPLRWLASSRSGRAP